MFLSVDPSCTASSECISGEGCNSAGDCGTGCTASSECISGEGCSSMGFCGTYVHKKINYILYSNVIILSCTVTETK